MAMAAFLTGMDPVCGLSLCMEKFWSRTIEDCEARRQVCGVCDIQVTYHGAIGSVAQANVSRGAVATISVPVATVLLPKGSCMQRLRLHLGKQRKCRSLQRVASHLSAMFMCRARLRGRLAGTG